VRGRGGSLGELQTLTECPKCGAENPNPVKVWPMSQELTKDGDILQQTMAQFKCQKCGSSFRKLIGREKISIKEITEKIKSLEATILEATKKRAELEEKVKALEEEKRTLQTEVEDLKVIAEMEAKSSALEDEVAKLKEEKTALEGATKASRR
jgi:uncharacterized protein YaaN involved in tellurite resistance